MATIQFTYNPDDDIYCFGFWVNGEFIVRAKNKDKDFVWQMFCEDLRILEKSRK